MNANLLTAALIAATFFAVMFGLVSLVLIRVGKRGRLVNDHPICRSCGFDLFNLPTDRERCPECGAELKKPKAVLPGRREPYAGRLYTGYVILLLAVFGFAWTAFRVFSNDASIALLPDFVVVLEAKHGGSATKNRSWRELVRRIEGDSLSDATITSVVDDALALQRDLSKAWIGDAGDFVQSARKQKHLDDERWACYAKQAVVVSLKVRTKIRIGDRLTAEVVIGPCRAGSDSANSLVLRNPTPQATGDLIRARPKDQNDGSHGQSLGPGTGGSDYVPIELDPKAMTEAALGKHELVVDVDFSLRDGWQDDARLITKLPMQLKGTWELVPKDTALVTHVPDDSAEVREAVKRAMANIVVKRRSNPPWTSVRIDMQMGSLPVPVGFQVTFREGDRTWDGFRFARAANAGPMTYGFGTAIKGFDANKVDVIFTPDERAVIETTGATQLWDGIFVIEDIPVGVEAPTTNAD